jgi:glutamate carboxypeptidase
MVSATDVREELRAKTPAMLAEIAALAAIDSGSYEPGGVERVVDAFGALLAARGFELHREAIAERGPGLRATLELGDGPRVLIVGHADTVWPAGTAASWPVEQRDGTLRGPGVGDMKGCLVMAVHAIGAAVAAGIEGIGAIDVLVVPDEELGSIDSREWIERHASDADACLGLEAGWPGGGVVVARGAVGAMVVVAHGRTAHVAGHDGEVASAISALAPLVAELEACSRPDDGLRVTVGIFRGGVARQVVPDHAELHVDLRAPDDGTAAAVAARIRGIVERRATPEVPLELRGGLTRPAFPLVASELLWELASARAGELGIPLEPMTSGGGSDASFAAALGVPTLDGLGPICHDSCSRDERIEVASLADRGALFATLLTDLAERWRDPQATPMSPPDPS